MRVDVQHVDRAEHRGNLESGRRCAYHKHLASAAIPCHGGSVESNWPGALDKYRLVATDAADLLECVHDRAQGTRRGGSQSGRDSLRHSDDVAAGRKIVVLGATA